MEDQVPKPPRGLGSAGKKLWKTYAGDAAQPLDDQEYWVFNTAELEVLARAARLEDVAERIRKELADAPLTVRGHAGQPVANSLINELRQTELAVHRLVQSLDIPAETEENQPKTGRFSSQTAFKAAQKRWVR